MNNYIMAYNIFDLNYTVNGIDKNEMAKAYLEMGNLNSEISNDYTYLESEAEHITYNIIK